MIWIDNRLGVEIAEKDLPVNKNASDEDEDNQCNVTTTTNKADSDVNYFLTKCPPFQNITVNIIHLKFGAIDFISALSTFLRNTFQTTVLPSIHDRFDVYKQLGINLPQNPYLSKHKQMDQIHTSPYVKVNGRSPEKPTHFDTAIVIEDPQLYKSDGLGGLAGEFLSH